MCFLNRRTGQQFTANNENTGKSEANKVTNEQASESTITFPFALYPANQARRIYGSRGCGAYYRDDGKLSILRDRIGGGLCAC